MAQVSLDPIHSTSEDKTFKEALVDENVLPGGVAFISKEVDRICKHDDGGGKGSEPIRLTVCS